MPITAPKDARTPVKRAVPRKAAQPLAEKQDPVKSRQENINGFGSLFATLLVMRGQYADAGAISIHLPPLSKALAEAADSDEKLASLLDSGNTVSPYMAIAAAAMPLMMQFLANHGRIDAEKAAGLGGIMSPDALEAKVRNDLEKQKIELLREAREAKETSAALLAEMQAEKQAGNGSIAERTAL